MLTDSRYDDVHEKSHDLTVAIAMAILGGYANGYMANMGIMFVKNLEADAGATPGTTWGSHLPALPEAAAAPSPRAARSFFWCAGFILMSSSVASGTVSTPEAVVTPASTCGFVVSAACETAAIALS